MIFILKLVKIFNMNTIESRIINRCVGCGVDMGDSNPRQYCCKSYCPNEEYKEYDKKLKVDKWQCGECTITNNTEKCILCGITYKSIPKTDKIDYKIALGLSQTARANTKF